DVYSISGEGTGGMFRPYRGDVGYVSDYNMHTKSKSGNFGLDLGFGYIFHGGVDVAVNNSYSQNNPWTQNNGMSPFIQFQKPDSNYQPVYFRNPGEKTSNTLDYYNSVGGDNLMNVKLYGTQHNDDAAASNIFQTYQNGTKTGELTVTAPIVKKNRDKRSQVIS